MDTKKTLLSSTLALLLAGFPGVAPTPADAQINSFEDTPFHVTLTRLPGVSTSDMGVCTGLLDPTSGSFEIICTRPAESSGDVLVTLGPPSEGNVQFNLGGGQVVSTTRNLSDEQVAMLLTGRLWVAMTTPSRPQGAIGARLVPRTPVGEHVMRFTMLQESLVGNTGSSASAHCALTIDADIENANLLCFHDVNNPGELRVIIDGGVVATRSNVDSPFEVSLPIIIDRYDRLLQGHIGVVLTSAAFPGGEIGMVLDKCIEGPNTLCLNAERFRVTVQVTPPGEAPRLAGTVPDRSKDAGLFWFFNPDNWEVMLKVLDACPLNQHFWVFLSANTNVAFKVTVYDTLTGRTQTYSNAQSNLAAPRADTTAFSCS